MFPVSGQQVWQIQSKVDKTGTASTQVCFGEKHSDEETLHDDGYTIHSQKHKQNAGISMFYNSSNLQNKQCIIFI